MFQSINQDQTHVTAGTNLTTGSNSTTGASIQTWSNPITETTIETWSNPTAGTSTQTETTMPTWSNPITETTTHTETTIPTWSNPITETTIETWSSPTTGTTIQTWTNPTIGTNIQTGTNPTTGASTSTWSNPITETTTQTGTNPLTETTTDSIQTPSIKVTIITMSGLEDDFFTLTDSNDTLTVQQMLNNLSPTSPPDWPILDFRGYDMEAQGIPSFPLYVRVFEGVIEISDEFDSYYYQDSHGLESFLSQKANSVGFQPTDDDILVKRADEEPAKKLPTSGSEPAYEPRKWNKLPQRLQNNCYAYATNIMTGTFPQPGTAGGTAPFDLANPKLTCAGYLAAAKSDGLVKVDCDKACPKGSHKVALVIRPRPPKRQDYHWFRQDKDGSWSHKPGRTRATDLDKSKQPITDPRIADRGKYSVFCDCFCVDPMKVKIA